jgi:hypothetical protein
MSACNRQAAAGRFFLALDAFKLVGGYQPTRKFFRFCLAC